MTQHHKVVSHDQWIGARKELLAKEKEFTRLRDQLSRQRRDLPWERVEKEYVFDGTAGRQSLAELLMGAASSSSITSCSGPTGKPDVRIALSGQTISIRSSSISTNVIRP